MKKLLLLSAILLGAATASQAGVRFNFGFGLPLPVPAIVAPAPVYQAPVYQAPCPPVYDYDYYSPSVVVSPPPLYFGYGHRYGYYPYRHYSYGHHYYGHGYYHGGHRRW